MPSGHEQRNNVNTPAPGTINIICATRKSAKRAATTLGSITSFILEPRNIAIGGNNDHDDDWEQFAPITPSTAASACPSSGPICGAAFRRGLSLFCIIVQIDFCDFQTEGYFSRWGPWTPCQVPGERRIRRRKCIFFLISIFLHACKCRFRPRLKTLQRCLDASGKF